MKTRKLSLRLIVASLVMLVMGVTEARAEVYYVSTAQDFISHWKANHSICIINDIDLKSFKEGDQCEKYTGELCSERKDGKASYYNLTNIPEMLAENMEGANIHDIGFVDCTPDWDNGPVDSNYGTSLLARYSKNNSFKNLGFLRTTINGRGFENMSSYGGCLVCHDEGSSFTKISAAGCKVYCDGPDAGTLVGEAKGSTFDQCNVYPCSAVYAGGNLENSIAGGLVGMAENCKFTDCSSTALVTGPQDELGGIVGKSVNTQFIRCNNYGSVKHGTFNRWDKFTEAVAAMAASAPLEFTSDELEKLTNHPSINAELADKFTAALAMAYPATGYMILSDVNHDYYAELRLTLDHSSHWMEAPNTIESTNQQIEDFFTNLEHGTPQQQFKWQKELNAYHKAQTTYSKVTGYCLQLVGFIMTVYTIAKIAYDAQDSDEAGGIVGLMEGGSAEACCNYGYVYSADAYAGGIAGKARDGANVKNCLNHGCVKGYEQTGGIVGSFEGNTLSTCLNVGNVNTGNSGNSTFGRIYGDKSEGASISHNYYSSDHYDEGNTTCAGVTQQMLRSGQTVLLLNQYDEDYPAEPVWRQTLEYDNFPTLRPYDDVVTEPKNDISTVIRTKNAFNFIQAIANQYSDIVLTGDIELNTSLANFSSLYMPFVGSIDGQGHRLKNMYFVASTANKGGMFNNDNTINNVGLLSVAQGATFKDLELCDFNIAITSLTENCGLLVGNSNNCTYDNIRITGASRINTSAPLYKTGALVGYSSRDTFTDCSTGPLCKIEAASSPIIEEVIVGGLVGEAHNSSFLRCINRAAVSGDDDVEGGIVAQTYNCTLDRCVNLGAISGCEYLGGIIGYAEDTEIHLCANTGLINCTATAQESEVGGIVGRYAKNEADKALSECANWGDVHYSAGENQGAIYGDTSGSPSVHDNYYCFVTEDGDHPAGCVDQAKVLSGEWAYVYDTSRGEMLGTRYYYQDIDNNNFGTHYPVPAAGAGAIYNNWDCKTQSYRYSNAKVGNANHTTELDKFGLCSLCGSVYEAPATVEIGSNRDMIDLAYAVNKGQNFGNSVITLTKDIDYNEANNFNNILPCIGTAEHPFSGTFEGNYHTISNLVVEEPATVPGLFGTVTGNVNIRNLIMDNTCALRSTGWGAGGFVGCSRGSTDLSLTNLGFEGFVSGYKNVAAILGGTFSVEGAELSVMIDHCYNSGTVQGDTESASLCGYAANAGVIYSWNSGKVTGYSADRSIIRGNCSLMRCCYDVNSSNDDNHITAEDVTSGQLAYYLNESTSGWGGDATETGAWYQQIGVEEHPSFIRYGDHTVYRHTFRWCDDHQNIITYYDNESVPAEDAMTLTHDYGDNGICSRTEGELHFEACPQQDDWWWPSKMGHLYYIAELVNSGAEMRNIDLQADLVDNPYVFRNGALATDAEGFRQWTPIGKNNVFTKSFKGNNHTISGLYSNPTEQNYQTGLFGQIGGNASVSNVGIKDSYFGNAMYAGAIAGVANADNTDYPTISHCYASDGAVSTTMAGGGLVGVYIGGNEPADFTAPITDCYNTCTVSATSDEVAQNVGGILGLLLAPAGFQPTVTADCYYLEGCTTGTSGHGEAKSEQDFRFGYVCQLLNEGVWSQSIDKQQIPVFGEGGTSYARKVTPGYWGSLILPFPVTSDDDVQYYTYKNITLGGYNLDEGELHLQKVDVVPANTPCFFRTSDECYMLSATAAANSVVTPTSSLVKKETFYNSKVYLIGSYDNITVEPLSGMLSNYFVAQNKLWWGERAFNLGAFRSYIKMTDSKNGAKSLSFVIDDDDETTGITTTIDAGQWNGKLLQNGKVVIVKNGVKYNAAGQRIL